MKAKIMRFFAILTTLAMLFSTMPSLGLASVYATGETPAEIKDSYEIDGVKYNNIFKEGDEDYELRKGMFSKSSYDFLKRSLTVKNIKNTDTAAYLDVLKSYASVDGRDELWGYLSTRIPDSKLEDWPRPVNASAYTPDNNPFYNGLKKFSSSGVAFLNNEGEDDYWSYTVPYYVESNKKIDKKIPIKIGEKYMSEERSLSNTWDYIAPVALSIVQEAHAGRSYAGYDSYFRQLARYNNTDEEVNVPYVWDEDATIYDLDYLHRSELMEASSMKQMEEKVAWKLMEYMNGDSWGPVRRDWAWDRFFANQKTNIFTRKFADDTTEQPVFFKLFSVNSILEGDLHLGKREGEDMHGHRMKSAFVLLYSDFKISPLLPEDKDGNYFVDNETSSQTGDGIFASNVRNMTGETVRADQQIGKSQSASVSSSISGSESYGFEESIMVGAEHEFPSFTGKIEVTFTANQAIEKGWEEGKETSEESSQNYNVGVDLPPYTTVMLKQQNGSTSRTSRYNCPVSVSFRVRVLPIYTYNSGTDTLPTKYTMDTAIDIKSRKEFNTRARESANYTDIDGIKWGPKMTEGGFSYNVKEGARNVSMGTTDANFVEKFSSTNTEITGIAPILPLSSIVNTDKVYEYQMSVGDYSYLDSIALEGMNAEGAPYYGFDAQKGHWEIVDEEGNPVSSSDPVAKITKTPANLTKMTAEKAGKVYLKYFIDEDCYATADDPAEWRKNSQLKETVIIEVNVKEEPFDGSIEVDGSFTGYLGDDYTTFTGEDGITAAVVDNSGKELERLLTWEAKELPSKGIEVQESGTVKFTKTGTFHVRAISGDVKSEWIEIKAERKPVKASFYFQGTENPTVVETLRGENVTAPESPDPCVKIDGWYLDQSLNGDVALQDKGSFDIWDDVSYFAKTSLDHSMIPTEKVDAKCTENGAEAFWTCQKCNDMFSDENGNNKIDEVVVIPYDGHDLIKVDQVNPDCDRPGTAEHWMCTKCNAKFSDDGGAEAIIEPEEIPAGHDYDEWIPFNEDEHQRICSRDNMHIETQAHTWDEGMVTQKATESAEGIKTYACTVCKATKTESMPKLTPAPTPEPIKTSGTSIAKMVAGKNSITINWNKIQGAEGYDVFFSKCSHRESASICKKVKTIKGNNTFSWTKKGLKKGMPFKAYVKAYVVKDGKKEYVKTSPMVHAFTGNGNKKYTNVKSLAVNKTKVSLAKGKSLKIKTKISKQVKNKKLMPKGHTPILRYLTTDANVAIVNSGGKITAKGKGTCTIIVFAHNGVSKKIKVTVK